MSWLYLFIAGLFECVWAVGLKYSHGFTRFWPSIITLLAMIVSFGFLSLSLKNIPMGTAYAVWTGIGAVGVVLYGIFVFNDSTNIWRLICIGFIVLGVLGLKLVGTSH